MQITPQMEKALHQALPIDENEKILAVYKHHWWAYVSLLLVTFFVVAAVLATAALLLLTGGDSLNDQARTGLLAGALLLSVVVLLGGMVPVYLKSQERLVLTDEALVQVLQPAIMSTRIEQLGLNDLANISVHNDFLGGILGYSHLNIETPGEQNNFFFRVLGSAKEAAREIAAAHENYEAALEGGRLKSTLGEQQAAPQIDPVEYQEFLKYQAMKQQAGKAGDDKKNF